MKTHSNQKEVTVLASSFIPSFFLLRKNDPLRLAGATAFFTTFALPPIVFILAQLFGLFTGSKMVGHGLILTLASNLGNQGALQIRDVIKSIRGFSNNWYIVVFGLLFLLFVATTLFMVIKNSLHQLWQINVSENKGILFNLGSRLKSFAVIVFVGLLFFVNLFFKSIETIFGNYFENHFKGSVIYFNIIFNEISNVIIVAAWFTVLFRFLTDKRPNWKASIFGGILTGVLFTIGRFLLKILLINSNIGYLYGASASIVLILLFVFYTSFIMYYGACFIAVYSEKKKLNMK